MSSINFVSNTINNQQSIINRRVAANRLAAAIKNAPVVKRVFVIRKMEEEVASQVEVVKNKPLSVFVSNQISEYVPVSIPDNVPVVFLKSMN